MKRILLVDDEESILKVLTSILEKQGFEIIACSAPEDALRFLESESFDLLITDLRMGAGMDGLELMHRAHLIKSRLPIIMITAHATINVAVEAMKEGAYDFITKPFQMEQLLEVVKSALQDRTYTAVGQGQDIELHFGHIIGESPEMKKLYELIERISKADATVLIQGESGTGKELVAKAVHNNSKRANAPFVGINCSAIPANLLESEIFGHVQGAFTGAQKDRDGLFIASSGGTVFLDEIATMDLNIQSKFLRVLQEKKVKRVGDDKGVPVDVRIIAATNEPLHIKKDAGEFREDLFYRICVIPINLPPLRRRVEDIPLLVQYFCAEESKSAGGEITVEPEAMEALLNYSWPGNIRELENAIACASALCYDNKITLSDLPPHIASITSMPTSSSSDTIHEVDSGKSLRDFLKQKEKEYLQLVLEKTGGNRAKAASLLGISRASLYRKLPDEE